ncbi:MAG: 4Fe-4S binding protein [Planctomycetota bacterium]
MRGHETHPAPLTSHEPLKSEGLRQLVLDAGADDVGFVDIGRPALDDQRADILRAFPRTKALISFVVRMNREPIRSAARSVANLEFHRGTDGVGEVGHAVVRALEDRGVAALNPAPGFPMEMDKFPGRTWIVSHKPVAVAAGLGKMGIHRNVIHPKFGNFVLLGTILVDTAISDYGQAIDYNPCLECKLCVASCPVGAISPNGDFNFSACYTHNYREFMGGFSDWAGKIASSKSALGYRAKVSESESASMWQSLSFGANYKAAYCLSVCPAGEDVIAPYLDDRKSHVEQHLRPLQAKEETIYVLKNSDAADHVAKRFPHKDIKQVENSLHSRTVDGFMQGLGLVFQPGKSVGIEATYHFSFVGAENRELTVVIRDRKLQITEGHQGKAELKIRVDTKTWFGFLAKEKSLVWALLSRRIRLRGSPKWLLAFGKCFPQ